MHQPDYVDPVSGERFMPWTRLHALKDYADMAEHLARHPGVRATFNVVPALLTELVAYRDRTAKPDAFLAVPAAWTRPRRRPAYVWVASSP
jgi:alpha-amylase/alpha-mannosidase (GH57 family)